MADAFVTQGGGTCPTCGSAVQRGQLVCLSCGGRVALRYRKPPRWQVPVILATLVVVLAVAGVFVGLQAATGEGEDEVAAGPASRQETPQNGPKDGQPTGPATTGTKETTESRREPKPKMSTRPARPEDAGLRAAKRGPTAVLSGVAKPGAAARFAKGLERKGFRAGPVTNAPGPAARSSVLYARGSESAARALAKESGIRTVRRLDRATAQTARGAKLVVIVGTKA